MTNYKKLQGKILSVGIFFMLGIIFMLPNENADKVNFMGYKSVNSYAPFSSLVSFIIAFFFLRQAMIIYRRMAKNK